MRLLSLSVCGESEDKRASRSTLSGAEECRPEGEGRIRYATNPVSTCRAYGVQSCTRRPVKGLDIARGTGALLLALEEAVPDLVGIDIDELALRVASVALPSARFICSDGLEARQSADVVVGNPPMYLQSIKVLAFERS